jgi:hypothetical protein
MEMRHMRRSGTLVMVCAALASTALGLFSGCDEDKGQFIPNDPPSVRLTAFPPDSGTSKYNVEFYWEGWDSDGEVDYFIYAIDPPDMYGSGDSVWTRIDAYHGSFVFEAADFDTLYNWRKPQIAKGWHVFVIKSVDDRGAISEPDYVAFNATTIAPRTQFTTPPPYGGIEQYMGAPQEVGLRVTFRWEGEDPDGLFSEVPVGYLLKVVDVSGKGQSVLAKSVWADTTEWIAYGQNERKAVLDLDNLHNYAVTVRAVDEAGAVEPLLLLNGNMMWVAARQSSAFPELTVRSTAFGRRTWRGWALDVETYEVTLGSRQELRISGNADWYGGLITGYSYGWDLSEPESNEMDPSGEGAWTPWSMSRTVIAAEFTEDRDRHLYIRCKDDAGARTLAAMKFRVIPLGPPKNLCYIDDWRRYPKTSIEGEPLDDEVWQMMLEGYNYGEDWADVSWDEWDAPSLEHTPSLEFLSQFRVVVWSLNENRSMGLSQKSAWFHMNSVNTSNVLAAYMTGRISGGERGKVWAFGKGLVEGSLLADLGIFCSYPYAVDHDMNFDPDCGIKEHTFASEFLHITGEFDESDKASGGARVNLFSGSGDWPYYVFVDAAGPAIPGHKYTRPPAAQLYPNLPSRLQRHPAWWSRSPSNFFFEVLEYPAPDQEQQHMFYDPALGEMTGLIPIYRLFASSTGSNAHNKYCGFRYVPSDPSDPGEIVYFMFPMFLFRDSQIRATAKVVLSNWFGLPDPGASSGSRDEGGLGGGG